MIMMVNDEVRSDGKLISRQGRILKRKIIIIIMVLMVILLTVKDGRAQQGLKLKDDGDGDDKEWSFAGWGTKVDDEGGWKG